MKKHRRPTVRTGKPASRKVRKTGLASRRSGPVNWLPIDNRLIPHIFSFGRVKGIARVFLQVEMMLSIAVVFGSLVLFILQLGRVSK